MKSEPNDRPDKRGGAGPGWQQLAGMGAELATGLIGLTLAGWWLDSKFGTAPTWLLIGAALGIIGGMYNLIRQAQKMIRANQPPKRHDEAKDHDEPGERQ